MTPKEGIEKVKEILVKAGFMQPAPQPSPAPAPAPAVLETQELKTVDGKTLTVDKLEVGGNVLLDGAAAPDGEYQLEGGNSLQVSGGQIVELSSPKEDTLPEEAPAQDMAKFAEQFSALKTDFEAHKEAFAKSQSELNAQKEAFANLLQVVEALTQQPAQAPAEPVQKSFSEMTPLEKFRASRK